MRHERQHSEFQARQQHGSQDAARHARQFGEQQFEAGLRHARDHQQRQFAPPERQFGGASNGGGAGMAAVLGAAALGLVAGVAATQMKKVAVQAASTGAATDWLDALKTEHRAVEAMFDKLLETSDEDAMKRTMLLKGIAAALSKHAFEEEMVIYPALRMAEGEETARRLFDDHADVKTFIYELDTTEKTTPFWLARARDFQASLMQHVREEEDAILPRLHERLGQEENAKLTRMMHMKGVKLA